MCKDGLESIYVCQIPGQSLRIVQFKKTSDKILQLAVHDLTMRARLAGEVSDLCAEAGLEKVEDDSKSRVLDPCMNSMCCEKRHGLSKGYVHDMAKV